MGYRLNGNTIRSLLPGWEFCAASFVLWTLFGLFVSTLLFSLSNQTRPVSVTLGMYLRTVIYCEVWAVLTALIYPGIRYIQEEVRIRAFLQFFIHIPAGVFFALLHIVLFAPLMWLLSDRFFLESGSVIRAIFDNITPGVLLVNLLIYSLSVITIQSFNFFRSYRNEEARNLELQHELTKSQLQSLKMQLQPHFLFNTLHSISSLNMSDVERANAMIARLGDFLRLTLESSDRQMVTLREELEFVRQYLGIEEIRFGDRLRAEFEIDSAAEESEVPHLILQPIVENAIKHGIAPFEGQGSVVIAATTEGERLSIDVRNNVLGNGDKSSVETNGGRGFENVRSRLEKIYESDFRFELSGGNGTGEYVARLEIPMRIAGRPHALED